jgi:hypothetical protein
LSRVCCKIVGYPRSSNGNPLFLSEEPVKDGEQQDCFLLVEIHAPDGIDNQWVHQAAEDAIEDEFAKRLTLWSANEEEASQYLQADPGATHGLLELGTGVPLFWHLLRIA